MFNKTPKLFLSIYLVILLLQLVSLLFIAAAPLPAQAISFKPQVPIPGYNDTGVLPADTSPIANYIKAIYKYAIGVVGIVSAVVIMYAGVLWLTAGGNAERVSNARAWIGASLTGLLLALTSYLILSTINPALVNFQVIALPQPDKYEEKNIQYVSEPGCCVIPTAVVGIGNQCLSCSAQDSCGTNIQVCPDYFYNINKSCDDLAECKTAPKESQTPNCIDMVGRACGSLTGQTCCSPMECNQSQLRCYDPTNPASCVAKPNGTDCTTAEGKPGKCQRDVCEQTVTSTDPACAGKPNGTICSSAATINGYCENEVCSPCRSSGAECYHNRLDYECAGPGGLCGKGNAGDCDGNFFGICTPCVCK